MPRSHLLVALGAVVSSSLVAACGSGVNGTSAGGVVAVPDVADTDADATRSEPDALEAAPDALEPASDTADSVPDAANPIPDTADSVPDAANPIPDTADPVPDTADPVADIPEPTPELPDPTPDTGDAGPDIAIGADSTADTGGPVDECAEGLDDCSPNATCTDSEDGYECTCHDGYEGDGRTCSDIDECALDNGGCSQRCSNFDGTFACCAPEPTLPLVAGCDGVVLTAPEHIEAHSDDIATVPGPGGVEALRIEDGQSMDLVDAGCLQLGRDGADFSLSMWLRASGGSQIIGTKTQYNGDQGFILYSVLRDDGLVELQVRSTLSAEEPSSTWRTVKSATFQPDVWTHAAVTYRNDGDQSAFSIHVNTAARTGRAHPDVHNENLRIGDEGWGQIATFDISDLRSFGRQLDDTEIWSLFVAGAENAGFSAGDLAQGLDDLRRHVDGTTPLDAAELELTLARITDNLVLLGTSADALEAALDLVDSYEAAVGPLFLTPETRNGIARSGDPGDARALARAMIAVQQGILDQGYRADVVNGCRALLDGRGWRTADYFPGAAPQPDDPEALHTVTIRAEVPPFWGRPVAFSSDPARRPTGFYLPPGSVGRVVVPPELVDAGYTVLVGAHTADHQNKGTHKRLDRVSLTFPITEPGTYIAHPLGGGVYIVVPYVADLGLVEVQLGGVIEGPFFSLRSFDETTTEEWLRRRETPGPWADFESDTFMMQVPRSWIFAFDDPRTLMETWDVAMDGVSDLLGYPPAERNRTVLYQQVDVQIRHGVYGIGYPQINNPYNPHEVVEGFKDHWLLTDPTGWEVDYHELGHAQLMSRFPGETEANVNFLHAYVRNVQFGVDFDVAFQQSFGPSYGDVGFSPDNAAIHWMLTENFRNGRPMDRSNTTKDQFRYQQRGYAKYADIARLFDWQALRDFHHTEHLEYMAGAADDGLEPVDSRIFRMSVAAGADLTPLIHFWGVHPVDPAALQARVDEAGLAPSTAIRDQIVRYAAIAPADNAAFKAHFDEVYPGMPPGGNPDYGVGWYNEWTDVWDAGHYDEIVAALQDLLDLYFPGTQL